MIALVGLDYCVHLDTTFLFAGLGMSSYALEKQV